MPVPPGLLEVPKTDAPTVLRQDVLWAPVNTRATDAGYLVAEDHPKWGSLIEARKHIATRLLDLVEAGLPVQTAFYLLRYTVGGDATWLARTTGIPATVSAQLDACTWQAVQGLLKLQGATEATKDLVFLPTKLGGMGLTSAEHMAEPANLASWNTALRAVLLRTGHDDAASLAAEWNPFRPTLRPLEQAARVELDETEIPSLPLPAHLAFTQRALTQRAQQQALDRWSSRPEITDADRAWRRSCGGAGSGLWLRAADKADQVLPDETFRTACGLRLSLPLVPPGTTCPLKSQAGTACGVQLDASGRHVLTCAFGGAAIHTHNLITKTVAAAAAEQGATSIQLEPLVGHQGMRADIAAAYDAGGTRYHDVRISDPCSRQALRAGAARRDGAAAGVGEADKRSRWRDTPVQPLVLEAGGRAGTSFNTWLRLLLPSDDTRSEVAATVRQSVAATLQRGHVWALSRAGLLGQKQTGAAPRVPVRRPHVDAHEDGQLDAQMADAYADADDPMALDPGILDTGPRPPGLASVPPTASACATPRPSPNGSAQDHAAGGRATNLHTLIWAPPLPCSASSVPLVGACAHVQEVSRTGVEGRQAGSSSSYGPAPRCHPTR